MIPTQDRSDTWARGAGVLVILSLLVIASFGVRTISNTDFWQHLVAGRWVAEHGIPRTDTMSFAADGTWVNARWLYDLLLYGLWSLGRAPLVILVHAAAAVLAFVLLLPVARKWAGGGGIAFALLLSAWLLAPRLVVGPRIVSMLLASLVILLLSLPRKTWWHWAALLVLQVFWTNTGASFVLGPLLAVFFAVETWLGERARAGGAELTPEGRSHVVRAAALAAGLAVVTVVNPYGPLLHVYVLRSSTNTVFSYVQEWVSVFSNLFRFSLYAKPLVTVVLLIAAGGLIAERRKLPLALTTMAVVGAFLVVRSLRYTEVFIVLAFPFIALSLSALGRYAEALLQPVLKERVSVLSSAGAAGTAVLAILSLGAVFSNLYYVTTGSASSFGLVVQDDLFPAAASKVIGRPDFPARAINLPCDGAFLAWRLPGRQIFVDQRADLYGVDLFQTLNQCLVPGPDWPKVWSALEDKWEPGAVILNCCVPGSGTLARNLLLTGRWALAYFDGTTAILVRAVSENQALVADTRVQTEGLEVLEQARKDYDRRLGRKVMPGVPPRLVGAGNLFMSLGRYEEARTVYSLLAQGAPCMVQAWLSLGNAQAQLGQAAQAVSSLRRASQLMPKSAVIWKCLYDACQKANLPEEAAAARNRAIRLNPSASAWFQAGGKAGTNVATTMPGFDATAK